MHFRNFLSSIPEQFLITLIILSDSQSKAPYLKGFAVSVSP
jgi:hypothetical protein